MILPLLLLPSELGAEERLVSAGAKTRAVLGWVYQIPPTFWDPDQRHRAVVGIEIVLGPFARGWAGYRYLVPTKGWFVGPGLSLDGEVAQVYGELGWR